MKCAAVINARRGDRVQGSRSVCLHRPHMQSRKEIRSIPRLDHPFYLIWVWPMRWSPVSQANRMGPTSESEGPPITFVPNWKEQGLHLNGPAVDHQSFLWIDLFFYYYCWIYALKCYLIRCVLWVSLDWFYSWGYLHNCTKIFLRAYERI